MSVYSQLIKKYSENELKNNEEQLKVIAQLLEYRNMKVDTKSDLNFIDEAIKISYSKLKFKEYEQLKQKIHEVVKNDNEGRDIFKTGMVDHDRDIEYMYKLFCEIYKGVFHG